MTYTEKVLKLIEQAAREGWTTLDLSNNQLTTLPAEMSKLTNLTYRGLSRNEFTSTPDRKFRGRRAHHHRH